MRVLIIGSGGREHALAWKLEQSPQVKKLHLAPGNGGEGAWSNVPIEADDIEGLVRYAVDKGIDLVVPGGETPLVMGIADACRESGLLCFGPDSYAARLEGSKLFAKEVMAEAGILTGACLPVQNFDSALAALENFPKAVVIKADGLAAGKGVVIVQNQEEAKEVLDGMFNRKTVGEAAHTVLLEEFLEGEEVSLLAFCDGDKAVPLPSAQDHKRAFDHDAGPNTGGMGAYSPAPMLPDGAARKMCGQVISPVLRVLKSRGHPFKGVLYAGLILTERGPMVLEYNVRFGDPECQPLLMRLQGDLLEIMLACVEGRLEQVKMDFSPQHAVCVVLAAQGYPGSYPKKLPISGLAEAEATEPERIKVFHAGTVRERGRLLSNGGRVLGVSCLGEDLLQARTLAYAAMDKIHMPQSFFRRDIADKGLQFKGR
ncbi:MAG: phosphoribosylamine--glycine ligase [Deltaproteobacteria bacterium]|nr:phosphoribosylamine--glycine ligase [Deltaproteobacteria bacterium]